MAPVNRTAVTSNTSSRRAQPSTVRPPLSPAFVNAHPNLCLAPRLMPVPLPPLSHNGYQPSTHISYPTAYVPPRSAIDGRGMHVVPGRNAEAGAAPSSNASHVYYPSTYVPPNAVTPVPSSSYATAKSPIATNIASLAQVVPVSIPKPHYTASPPTPTSSPPRPAVASRRKRSSADNAQRGAFPTT